MSHLEYLESDYCFCTLALGINYRLLTQALAKDLEKFAPGQFFVVGTDDPEAFRDYPNVIPFKLKQTGILKCYHDKRFVLAKSLQDFPTAIFIDADTTIVQPIPPSLKVTPGVIGYHEALLKHIETYRPQNVPSIKRVAAKLNINLEKSQWIGESLLIFTRDDGKEREFIEVWGKIASYLELKGMHSGQGNIMALAATKVGWEVKVNEALVQVNQARQHLDFGRQQKTIVPINFKTKIQQKLKYYYRLSKAKIESLKDFDFYYG